LATERERAQRMEYDGRKKRLYNVTLY
jgi:hypothetical protein